MSLIVVVEICEQYKKYFYEHMGLIGFSQLYPFSLMQRNSFVVIKQMLHIFIYFI